MRIGVYPGSFDPVTNGHTDIIRRGARLVDKLIVAVLENSSKTPLFTMEEKKEMLEEVTEDIENVEITSFSGLLVDFVKEKDADIIIRGLRVISDYEYEIQLAQTNHTLCDDIETVFLMTSNEYSYLSSSIVKEVATFGGDTSKMVAPITVEYLKKKFNKKIGGGEAFE